MYINNYKNFLNEGKLRQEILNIKEHAIENNFFLKSPNGLNSKLNELNWLYSRSNEFLNWFGKWINPITNQYIKNEIKSIDKETLEPKLFYHIGGRRVKELNIKLLKDPGFHFSEVLDINLVPPHKNKHELFQNTYFLRIDTEVETIDGLEWGLFDNIAFDPNIDDENFGDTPSIIFLRQIIEKIYKTDLSSLLKHYNLDEFDFVNLYDESTEYYTSTFDTKWIFVKENKELTKFVKNTISDKALQYYIKFRFGGHNINDLHLFFIYNNIDCVKYINTQERTIGDYSYMIFDNNNIKRVSNQ